MSSDSSPTAARTRAWLVRAWPVLVIGVIPALLLGIGVARFIVNHFFVRAPFLLDSGFYSALVYRAGLAPHNPNIAIDFADSYFAFHFSPLISGFSLLSYLQPLQRIEWYAVFQAAVFAPVGLAVLAATGDAHARRSPATFLAALAFSFSGLVIMFIGSPHYEPAIAGLLCLTLAALLTGRRRLGWCMLALTLAAREDGGVHAAFALAALAYLRWRGRDFPVALRTLVRMVSVALGWTVAAMFLQRMCFHAQSTFQHVYLGSPAFAHLDADTVLDRTRTFVLTRQVIYLPFLATAALATARCDAGYLLGWAATLPPSTSPSPVSA